MTLSKDEMVQSVKDQLELWRNDPGKFGYNTGPKGKANGPVNYAESDDIKAEDFKAACAILNDYVKEKFPGYLGRLAKSMSGTEQNQNIWSFLCEPVGDVNKRKLNYHIKVDGKV